MNNDFFLAESIAKDYFWKNAFEQVNEQHIYVLEHRTEIYVSSKKMVVDRQDSWEFEFWTTNYFNEVLLVKITSTKKRILKVSSWYPPMDDKSKHSRIINVYHHSSLPKDQLCLYFTDPTLVNKWIAESEGRVEVIDDHSFWVYVLIDRSFKLTLLSITLDQVIYEQEYEKEQPCKVVIDLKDSKSSGTDITVYITGNFSITYEIIYKQDWSIDLLP